MINRRIKKMYLVLFITVFCMNWVWWIVWCKLTDKGVPGNDESKVAFPKLSRDTYETFSDDFEKYWDEVLPFRKELVSLNSQIDYSVFHCSSSERVILGKNNWLFYNDVNDGDSLACYQGRRMYTENELEQIACNLENAKEYLYSLGIEFVVFIAPNKERIYYENMPDFYGIPSEDYLALQVVTYLQENTDIRVVYPYDDLMLAKDELGDSILLFHKGDTHWNAAGGYVGSAALLKELGIEIPPIKSDELQIKTIPSEKHDLANILQLGKNFNEIDYDIVRTDTVKEDGRVIYVCRDSFYVDMERYVAEQFKEDYVIHKALFTNRDLMDHHPDVFVYESVERYLDDIFSFDIRGNEPDTDSQ